MAGAVLSRQQRGETGSTGAPPVVEGAPALHFPTIGGAARSSVSGCTRRFSECGFAGVVFKFPAGARGTTGGGACAPLLFAAPI